VCIAARLSAAQRAGTYHHLVAAHRLRHVAAADDGVLRAQTAGRRIHRYEYVAHVAHQLVGTLGRHQQLDRFRVEDGLAQRIRVYAPVGARARKQ